MSIPSTPGKTGRERLAEVKELEARQAKQRRMLALVAGVVTIAVLGVAILWFVSQGNKKKESESAEQQARNSQFIKTLTTIPAATYDKVGFGAATGVPSATDGPQDKVGDKPRVLYVGAEFCPFCAVERWSLVSALSRFGTWDGLAGAVSSPNEGAMSNIQTVTFKDATYTSKYIAFKGWETRDRMGEPLQTMSDADSTLVSKYNDRGSIPFVLIGGKSTTQGATWDGRSLPGMTNTEIAEQMADPNSAISKGAVGAANVYSAQICTLTGQQPANVCNSAGVKAAAAKLEVK